MAINNPTASLLLDKTHPHTDGKCPVNISVYYLNKKQRRSLKISLTEDEYDNRIFSPKLRDKRLKDIKVKLDYYVGKKFESTLKKMEDEPFTFERFWDIYIEKNLAHLASNDMYALFEKRIKELEEEAKEDEDAGDNVQVYQTALNSFKRFRKKLTISQVTSEFLKKYEKHMSKNGLSVTYISMNQRTLKAVWNWAKREGHIMTDNYPFTNYTIKKSGKKNIALNEDELKTLKNYKPKTDAQRRAFLFWWFSFYCNGIYMKDICLMKRNNIINDTIEIRRAKTRRTNQTEIFVRFIYSENIKSIIEELGNSDKSPDAFVFNILRHGINYKETRKLVQQHTQVVNKHMKKIGEDLGLSKKVTTKVARHSFATFLYRRDKPIGVISEALGHNSIQTTRIYLASFDEDTLRKIAELLDEI